jgi:hypothetical protein
MSDQPDRYRLWFNPAVKQGIANGNHSYQLLLDAQVTNGIPENQYVEIKMRAYGARPDWSLSWT